MTVTEDVGVEVGNIGVGIGVRHGIETMVTSIGTMVTSTWQRDTAITMTIATTTTAAKIIQSLPPTHRSEQFDTGLGSAGR